MCNQIEGPKTTLYEPIDDDLEEDLKEIYLQNLTKALAQLPGGGIGIGEDATTGTLLMIEDESQVRSDISIWKSMNG